MKAPRRGRGGAGAAAAPSTLRDMDSTPTLAPRYLTDADVLIGYPLGHDEPADAQPGDDRPRPAHHRATSRPERSAPAGGDARAALEAVLAGALRREPCVVAFSGGRDSSAVLAVAAHVARREGLALPIPVTRVFPGVAGADETAWQELVIDHLGLRERWVRLELTDELDLVGPLAAAVLQRFGPMWPPTLPGQIPMLRVAAGGTLLDGEGGDEVLDCAAHRIHPVTQWARGAGGRQRLRLLPYVATALSPRPVRYTAKWARVPALAYLRPPAQRWTRRAVAAAMSARPLRWDDSVVRVPHRRTQRLLAHNRAVVAADYDVDAFSPLLAPGVVAGLATRFGALGPVTRTAGMDALFADVLPASVRRRTSKASFRGAFVNVHTQAFADDWSGAGIDERLVDPVALRRAWRDGHAPASALLQRAWLADRREQPAATAGTSPGAAR